jgi:DNA polymerase-3 subunit gamma/tau
MATTDAHKVPVTITSRSQVFTFKLADPSTMLEHLKNICKKEKIDIDDEALKIIVKRGGGSFRDSLSLLDQVSTLSDGKITAKLLNESLGLPQDELVEKLLNAYAGADTTAINQTLRELLDSGIKAEIIATELIDRILEKPEPAYLPLLDKLTDVSRNAHPNAKLLLAFYREQAAPRIVAPAPVVQKPAAPKATPIKPKAEPKEEPKPEPTPAKVTIVATGSSAEEIWQKVLENVRENAPMELSNFEKAHYCLNGTTFEVHATNAFIRKRLDTKRSLITSVLPESYTILISDQPLAVDPDIANIMDIVGGGEEIEIDE